MSAAQKVVSALLETDVRRLIRAGLPRADITQKIRQCVASLPTTLGWKVHGLAFASAYEDSDSVIAYLEFDNNERPQTIASGLNLNLRLAEKFKAELGKFIRDKTIKIAPATRVTPHIRSVLIQVYT
jgi:hypothetical protein